MSYKLKGLQKKISRKKQFYNNIENSDSDDNSFGEITSDDEQEVSFGYINKVFNYRYLCVKYLGRGTFSRVWMVLDLVENKYYAMKTIFPRYCEESLVMK